MIEPKIKKIDKSTFQITDKNNIIYGHIENYCSPEEEPLYFFHSLSKSPLSAQDLHQIEGLLKAMDNSKGVPIKIKNNVRAASCLMFDGTNFEDIINLFPFGTTIIEIMTYPHGVIYQIYDEVLCEWAYIINLDEETLEVWHKAKKLYEWSLHALPAFMLGITNEYKRKYDRNQFLYDWMVCSNWIKIDPLTNTIKVV